jgi:hypothetical protein
MRYAAVLFMPIILTAQPAASDQKLTEALIAEVHQLRLTIERMTLLEARTQLAISQLHVQEAALAQLSQQYNDMRSGSSSITVRRKQLAETVHDLELKQATAGTASVYQVQLRQAKLDLEEATAMDQEHSARESELASQLDQARKRTADARSNASELERVLDVAIQQLVNRQ